MVTKSGVYKTRVFDPDGKEEPPHTLGEKEDRGDPAYGTGVANKNGYDPNFPDTPYDANFATTPGALNDAPYKHNNVNRTYNGEFAADDTMVKSPKAFEFGKKSILPSEVYEEVPEDATFDSNEKYFTRSGDGTSEDPYIFTEVAIDAAGFANYVGKASRAATGYVRTDYLYRVKREFIERTANNGEVVKAVIDPVSAPRTRTQDTHHDADGKLIVEAGKSSENAEAANKLRAIVAVGSSEAYSESVDYYKKDANGNFVLATSAITYTKGNDPASTGTSGYSTAHNTATAQGHLNSTDFATLKAAGNLYKASSSYVALSSGDTESTVYDNQ